MATRFRRRFVLAPFVMLMLEACGGTASSEAGADPSGAPITAAPVPSGTATGAETPATTAPADPSAAIADPQPDVSPLPDGNVMQVPSACVGSGGSRPGNGSITRTTRAATGFTDVQVELSGEVLVQEGARFNVQVETDANLQDIVTAQVQGNVLVLTTKENTSSCFNQLRVIVTLPSLRAVELSGSGGIEIKKTSAANNVDLTLSGSGDITLSGNADALRIDLSGAGSIHLVNGSATSTSVDLSGAGDVDATQFSPGAVSTSIGGAGEVSL